MKGSLDESTDLLIKYVKEHPILYDPQHPAYKVGRKDPIWEQIGRQLQIPGDEAKRKWRYLKETYAKFLRNPSSPGLQKKYQKCWQLADRMCEFKRFICEDSAICYTENVTNNELRKGSNDSDVKGAYDNTCLEGTHPEVKKECNNDNNLLNIFSSKRKRSNEEKEEMFLEEDCSDQSDNKWCTSEFDAMENIFLGYAKIVKSFGPRRQADAKMKVAQVIMQMEIEHFEEMISSEKT